MTDLTDADRKLLTELLGEEYDLREGQYGNFHKNHTFTTGNDMVALMEKIVEMGKWAGLIDYCIEKWYHANYYVDLDVPEFIQWVMHPPRFAKLVAEWWRQKAT